MVDPGEKNLKYDVVKVLVHTASVQDRIIGIGEGAARQHVRLIEVQAHGTVYRYLTNALDLARLPTARAVALYPQRWRVEDAFAIVKRLLGLAISTTAPKTPSKCGVDHRAVVRRVDRLDRCRRRSVGVTVRRSLSGNGLPQSHRAQWYETAQSGRRGAPRRYSDMAVQCGLVIREVFHLPLRALEGLMRSIIPLLGVGDHSRLQHVQPPGGGLVRPDRTAYQ